LADEERSTDRYETVCAYRSQGQVNIAVDLPMSENNIVTVLTAADQPRYILDCKRRT
jgi:hypothetical protein